MALQIHHFLSIFKSKVERNREVEMERERERKTKIKRLTKIETISYIAFEKLELSKFRFAFLAAVDDLYLVF